MQFFDLGASKVRGSFVFLSHGRQSSDVSLMRLLEVFRVLLWGLDRLGDFALSLHLVVYGFEEPEPPTPQTREGMGRLD